MSNIKIPVPQKGKTTEETLQNVLDAYARLARAFSAFQTTIGSENIPFLTTEDTIIRSDRGETEIKGPLLVMKDKQSTPVLRLQMGYDVTTGKFVFNMYDAAGNLTIRLNDSGEAVFAGNIQTLKDASVGNNIYVGTPANFDDKGLYFFDSTTGAYTSIGVFLSEYAPDEFELLIANESRRINIYSGDTVLIGDKGVGTYLALLPSDGYFTLFSASDTDSQVKHGGSGDLHIQHEGTGKLWIDHQGENGIIKIEAIGNISIKSVNGTTFAQGKWKFDIKPYYGDDTLANTFATNNDVATALSGYATASDISSAIAAHVAAYHTP